MFSINYVKIIEWILKSKLYYILLLTIRTKFYVSFQVKYCALEIRLKNKWNQFLVPYIL